MRKRRKIERISITLPEDTLEVADRLARELDRSRSWVFAEAVRQYAPGRGPGSAEVREAPAPGYAAEPAGVGELRMIQLQADLALTPEQRVRLAEGTARVDKQRRLPRRDQILFFDRYEDYLDWKRREGVRL